MGTSEYAQWFPCPTCDMMVTGLVFGSSEPQMSATHCCNKCAGGDAKHDTYWCCGVPRNRIKEVKTTGATKVSCYIAEPDWASVSSPAPALLYLHGAATYLWPETIHEEVTNWLDKNAAAREYVVIAPLATQGEPTAIPSQTRKKKDRHKRTVPYVECFQEKLTWECFIDACRMLGANRVDFSRLCVTGISMGGQACWNISRHRAPYLAVAVPVAACCNWSDDAWLDDDVAAPPHYELAICQYSGIKDDSSYNVEDFEHLATQRGLGAVPREFSFRVRSSEMKMRSWGYNLHLGLVSGKNDGHNCWDSVYIPEEAVGLFRWMKSFRSPSGHLLAQTRTSPQAKATWEAQESSSSWQQDWHRAAQESSSSWQQDWHREAQESSSSWQQDWHRAEAQESSSSWQQDWHRAAQESSSSWQQDWHRAAQEYNKQNGIFPRKDDWELSQIDEEQKQPFKDAKAVGSAKREYALPVPQDNFGGSRSSNAPPKNFLDDDKPPTYPGAPLAPSGPFQSFDNLPSPAEALRSGLGSRQPPSQMGFGSQHQGFGQSALPSPAEALQSGPGSWQPPAQLNFGSQQQDFGQSALPTPAEALRSGPGRQQPPQQSFGSQQQDFGQPASPTPAEVLRSGPGSQPPPQQSFGRQQRCFEQPALPTPAEVLRSGPGSQPPPQQAFRSQRQGGAPNESTPSGFQHQGGYQQQHSQDMYGQTPQPNASGFGLSAPADQSNSQPKRSHNKIREKSHMKWQ